MMRTRDRRLLAAGLILSFTGVLGGCGTKYVVKADEAAQTVAEVFTDKTGVTLKASAVKCPDGIEAEVGYTFDCHFTVRNAPYVAHVQIVKAEGERVILEVESVPQK